MRLWSNNYILHLTLFFPLIITQKEFSQKIIMILLIF